MEQTLRQMAGQIMIQALAAVQPDAAVRSALEQAELSGRVYLVAIGKAAWQMANAAYQTLGARITDGVVITKHGHSRGAIGSLAIFEAGHPVADAASFAATRHALALTERLTAEDTVLFLVSGGGSSLFELPFITPEEQQRITRELLACGADIVEMNTIRKRLSRVKAGRFAQHCAPARVFSIVLSDIVGDPLDMIASGPAYPDASTAEQALAIVKKYALHLSDEPLAFYAAYFYRRSQKGGFDAAMMCHGIDLVKQKIQEIKADEDSSAKDEDLFTTLEVCYEYYLRGFDFAPIDLYKSHATKFVIEDGKLLPPFVAVSGLGESAAWDIMDGREGKTFLSIEEFSMACPKVSKSHIEDLKAAGAFGDLPENNQMTLF